MWSENPVPLEESDPELAEFFQKISNKEVPYAVWDDEIIDKRTGRPVVASKISRNDPCPCGSGKKYKKCCARK
jgi:uncharacterized protein YecA (UPF0149 family)